MATRNRVSLWIREAIVERTEDWFVLTSRYAGYRGEAVLGPDFEEAHVRPLEREQRATFVRGWYKAVELQVGERGLDGEAEGARKAAALIAALDGPDFRSRKMAEIAANPLMLSVLCIVHRKDTELPRRRVAVYAKATDVLLEHWQRGKQQVPLDAAAARTVLAPLAAWLHAEEGRADAAEIELAREVEPHLRSLADPTALGTDGLAFLRRIRDGSGLLVAPDPGRMSFLHLGFQEYLAALHLVRSGQSAGLAERLGSSWWQEVALLALGMEGADAEGFFQRLIASGALEAGGEVVDYAFADALRVPVGPFLEALEGEPARATAALRRMAGRTDAALVERARRLAEAEDAGLAEAAGAFLERAGQVRPRRVPRVGDTRVHEPSGVLLCWIPGGTFRMGSDENPEEQPIHEVTVPDFWLGKHPVTNAEYERFLRAVPGVSEPRFWKDRSYNQPDQPVVGVSWEEAQAFCAWAGLALPTEARWEHACRAGTTGRYSCPEEELDAHAWTGRNSGRRLPPVGKLRPNPWGLHDMHGNVWEWCADWFDSYTAVAQVDPTGPPGGSGRVFRGGSWDGGPGGARSAFRFRNPPWYRDQYLGFRVLLPPPG